MANMTIEQFRQVYDEWQQSGLTVQQCKPSVNPVLP